MRVVLDTSVMVAAIRSDAGASRRLLRAGLSGELHLLVSVPLMIEYEAVMTRPDHLAVAGIDAAAVGTILDAVAKVAEPVKLSFHWRPMLPDADDDMVLETAVNGHADGLVTFNLKDFAVRDPMFAVPIWLPRHAVQEMELRR